MYHVVCVAKYRRVVISDAVDEKIKEVCEEITQRYEMRFLEIGAEGDHVHFLVQSVPTYSPKTIVSRIKSITAREVFRSHPEVRKKLWGGEFWTDGYFVSTVGEHANEDVIRRYIQNQGKSGEYKSLQKKQASDTQMTLF